MVPVTLSAGVPILSLVPHLWQLQFRVTGGGRQAIGSHHCHVPPFIDSLSTDQAILSQSGLWSIEHPEDQWYLIALEFKVPGIPQATSQTKASSGQVTVWFQDGIRADGTCQHMTRSVFSHPEHLLIR